MNDEKELRTMLKELVEVFFIRSMSGLKKQIKMSGITMPQFQLLMIILHGGHKGVHDIGCRLDITSAAASQLVDKLVNAGFLERSENPEDRRGKTIALSGKGIAFLKEMGAERYSWIDDFMLKLDGRARTAVREAAPLMIEAARGTGGADSRGMQYDKPHFDFEEGSKEC